MRFLVPATTLVVALLGANGHASAQETPGMPVVGANELVTNCSSDAIATRDDGLAVDVAGTGSEQVDDRAPVPDFGDLCQDGRDPRCSEGNPVPDAPSFAPGQGVVRFLDTARLVVPKADVAPRLVPDPLVETREGPCGFAPTFDEPPRAR